MMELLASTKFGRKMAGHLEDVHGGDGASERGYTAEKVNGGRSYAGRGRMEVGRHFVKRFAMADVQVEGEPISDW